MFLASATALRPKGEPETGLVSATAPNDAAFAAGRGPPAGQAAPPAGQATPRGYGG